MEFLFILSLSLNQMIKHLSRHYSFKISIQGIIKLSGVLLSFVNNGSPRNIVSIKTPQSPMELLSRSRESKFLFSESCIENNDLSFKGALSGLRQVYATENLLKMMKYAFYFTSKVLFVLKIFKFLF